MGSIETSTSSNWEKEFFTTWLRLMERQKDEMDLTQALQSLLTQEGDATTKLQDAKHHVNMMSANDKTMTELVAQLNEFFFRDIVPALKRMRRAERQSATASQRQEDPLDRYLEHGDYGTVMSQSFVNDMSGWAVQVESVGQEKPKTQEEKKKVMYVSSRVEEEEYKNDDDSDDEIPSDMLHDMLIANSLKLTAMQAPDYATMTTERVFQQKVAAAPMGAQGSTVGSRTSEHSPVAAGTSRTPSFILTSPDVGAAANLVAQQVLDVRTYGKVKEYLIRWKGVPTPLWIARRKSSPQAKELIDAYVATMRQDRPFATKKHAGRKRSSRHEANVQDAVIKDGSGVNVTKFYTVDHIVSHRTRYNKRQYLVRWENYSESQDTWENANKLRVDVPDIVDTYEEKIRRCHTRAAAMSDVIRGPNLTAIKQGVGNVDVADKSATQLRQKVNGVAGEKPKKRRCITTDDESKKRDDPDEIFSEQR